MSEPRSDMNQLLMQVNKYSHQYSSSSPISGSLMEEI